ncbi:hypothetical protein A2154_01020 [Candidatus Gottesmanbacteria bacterium RBG_16_43_7]|uniref:Penicillin-binding protein transpeptidase domain-containing protein n=1 Tax=Candidatus Gottesmanbacteria bacterium RBG_16_43_7 TaxID=1798373 RepID=A0A1F5Z7Y5_9BACT|nr:MAG: hypothetical protein A2154_01020 [Candidatus Gottesmanbacteria bacterium RBG_16_43_7]
MSRISVLFILFLAQLVVIILRLFYLQVISAESLKVAAARQHNFELHLSANRGQIKTSDDRILVMNQPAYLVYAKPNEISDPRKFTESIGQILTLNLPEFMPHLSDRNRYWLPLARDVDPQTADELIDLGLDSIGIEKESVRFYPEASMAAQVLGFVGSDTLGNRQGYFGLEGYYDRELRGHDGYLRQEKDVHGNPILIGGINRIAPVDGRNLITYLDRTVQYIVEEKLKDGIKKYGAKEGIVIVMNPQSGGILSMASYPSYEPASFRNFDEHLYKNPAVSSFYEPGSTFKVLVMSAAVNEGLVKPEQKINESGPVNIGPYSIRTWDNKYHGLISMTDVLVHSSNVGMVYVGRQLGIKRLLYYLHDFGFGDITSIDLQEESSPDMRPDQEWKEIDMATASFGQGIAVTPIQMITAVSAIASGGWLVEPRVVKAIEELDGTMVNIKPERKRQVIKPATAAILTEMMVAAVERGESKWPRAKGYRVAGKTGTAQIPVAGHYDATKTIASFVGFAPADNPRFVILVLLREPTTSPWGSETAAPLFFSIANELFTYYAIPPD